MSPSFPFKNGVNMGDIMLTDEGSYSYTKRADGMNTIQFLRQCIPSLHTRSVLDGTACVGADTILFSLNCRVVHGIELDDENFRALQHNVNLYELDNVHLHHGDTIHLYQPSDILYLDVPWGGSNYKQKQNIDLYLGDERVDLFLRSVISNDYGCKPKWIVLKLPFNYNWTRLTALQHIETIHTRHIRNYRIVILKIRS
jgi:predicted RNA methylase